MKTLTSCKDGNVLVQFSGHLRPFGLKTYCCENFGCLCNSLTVELVEMELDGRAFSRPICFSFTINLETWQKEYKTPCDTQIIAMMDEFMQDCSGDLKASLLHGFEHRQKVHSKLADFTMPAHEIKEGILVSFSQVMTDEDKYSGFPQYGRKFVWKDKTYYLDDLYCPNPDCDCKAVHLLFLQSRQTGEDQTLRPYFIAHLSLDGNLCDICQQIPCSKVKAKCLIQKWLEYDSGALKAFKWRYKEVRKATKRILKNSRKSLRHRAGSLEARSSDILATSAANGLDVPVGNIGRNEPCPCGSGKKYKKCCGQRK